MDPNLIGSAGGVKLSARHQTMDDELTDNIRQVAQRFGRSQRVCCMTGAGVSAESGVATFRGPEGLWEGRRPEEVATPEAFERDPQSVWRFYLHRRQALQACQPNAGHVALAKLEGLLPEFTLITQNVDGLHRLAGSGNVIELHGNIWINRCSRPNPDRGQPPCPEQRADPTAGLTEVPRCPVCGSMMRPGVVWFGESLPPEALDGAAAAAESCQVMLVAGTSSVVHPAAGLSSLAAQHGATVVEINPQDTPLSPLAEFRLRGPSGVILPAIVRQMGVS
ncbi:MAG: NAD-dependent deacetylase [Phycisphaerae bacterium]